MLKTRKERYSQNVCMVNIFKTAKNNEVGNHFEWLRKSDHCSSGLDDLKVSSQKIRGHRRHFSCMQIVW